LIGTGVESGLNAAIYNQRGGRGRGSGRGKDFLSDLGVELIGTGVESGLNAAIYNQRGGKGSGKDKDNSHGKKPIRTGPFNPPFYDLPEVYF
ncbi:hypothetical protein EC988_010432, partial [Linderina pennispora]